MIKKLVDATSNKILESTSGLSQSEIRQFIPLTGKWNDYYDVIIDMYTGLGVACGVSGAVLITKLEMKNSVLYVTTNTNRYSSLIKRIAQTLMTDSSKTCLVCGKFGRRRKDHIGFPALCPEHFLEYINEE